MIFNALLNPVCMTMSLTVRSIVHVVHPNMLSYHVKPVILILNQNQKSMYMKAVDSAQNLSAYYSKDSSNECYKLRKTFRTPKLVQKVHPNYLKRILYLHSKYSNKIMR